MYACETWTVYSRHAKKLNRLHLNYLRRLLHIFWQDKVPDTEVLNCTELPSVHTLLSTAQLRWSGHVTRVSSQTSVLQRAGLWGSSLLVPSKPPWKTLTSIQSHGRVLLLRDVLGAASSGRAPSPLKRTESAKQRRRGSSASLGPPALQHQGQSMSAQRAAELSVPGLASSVIARTHRPQSLD